MQWQLQFLQPIVSLLWWLVLKNICPFEILHKQSPNYKVKKGYRYWDVINDWIIVSGNDLVNSIPLIFGGSSNLLCILVDELIADDIMSRCFPKCDSTGL